MNKIGKIFCFYFFGKMKTKRNIFCLKTIFLLDIGIVLLLVAAFFKNPIIVGISCGFMFCGIASVVIKYENEQKHQRTLY